MGGSSCDGPEFDAEFRGFDKIPRLNRNMVITEKIDGTNGQINIGIEGQFQVGSRKRWITPEADNYGFATWAYENKEELIKILGPGRHFGEWWGQGIQRRYGQRKKIFSLFNTSRWGYMLNPEWQKREVLDGCLRVVPVLKQHTFDTVVIEAVRHDLRSGGSHAAPGFMDPEGIMIFHVAGNSIFKYPYKADPKGQS